MSVIPYIDVAFLLAGAGFPGGDSQANGVAIVAAESGRNSTITGTNTDGSVDRGLWQINSVAHAEVSDVCAFDPVCATSAAYRISNSGTDYTPWSAFNSGAYRPRLEAAKVALDAVSRIKALQKKLDTANAQVTSLTSTNSSLSAQVTALQAQLDSVNAQLTATLQNQSTLQAKLDQIKSIVS